MCPQSGHIGISTAFPVSPVCQAHYVVTVFPVLRQCPFGRKQTGLEKVVAGSYDARRDIDDDFVHRVHPYQPVGIFHGLCIRFQQIAGVIQSCSMEIV